MKNVGQELNERQRKKAEDLKQKEIRKANSDHTANGVSTEQAL